MGHLLLIVDDNPAVRSALHAYMSRVEGWETVLTASDVDGAIEMAAVHEPDAIVLDNRMPGRDGIAGLPDLRQACPHAKIVMHTSEVAIDLRDEAERLGADAVIEKGRPLAELAATLR